MNRTPLILLACATVLPFTTGHADTFGTGANTFTIDFATIGNPGNGDDRADDNSNNTPGNPTDDEYASPFGAVSYFYRMGVTEVPREWITKATNLGMENVAAGPWEGLLPATTMIWYEAAAFVNWLNTSTGYHAAYKLTFNNGWSCALWSSEEAWHLDGENLFRHRDARYFLPSLDEWYKSAFHQNDGVTANYWDYALGSNRLPTQRTTAGTSGGSAVYNGPEAGAPTSPVDVTMAGGLSPYGTMGQNGNVWEWLETAGDLGNDDSLESRVFIGAAYWYDEFPLRSSIRGGNVPTTNGNDLGFRVASIPEPASAALLAASAFQLMSRRRYFRSRDFSASQETR